MPAVCDLDHVRGALPDTVDECSTAITGNDFDGRMGLQPSGNGGWLTIRQEVNGLVPLQVHTDRPVGAAFLPCPVVDPHHTGYRSVRKGVVVDDPEGSTRADRHGKHLREARCAMPTRRKSERSEVRR